MRQNITPLRSGDNSLMGYSYPLGMTFDLSGLRTVPTIQSSQVLLGAASVVVTGQARRLICYRPASVAGFNDWPVSVTVNGQLFEAAILSHYQAVAIDLPLGIVGAVSLANSGRSNVVVDCYQVGLKPTNLPFVAVLMAW